MQMNETPQKQKMHFGWTVALVIAVIAWLQWPALKELYYQLSGTDAVESKIPWRHDFDSALIEARQSEKPLLVVFSAAWCSPCKRMKREVWPDEQVVQAVEKDYVPLYVDIDEQQQADVTARYQVRAIPAVFIVNANGDIIRQGNSMSRSQMLKFLDANRS
jgi:thioredoxin 1